MAAGTTVVKVRPRVTLEDTFFSLVEEGYVPVFPQASRMSEQDASIIREALNAAARQGDGVAAALLLLVIWLVMWAILSNLAMPQLIITYLFTLNTVDGTEDPSLLLGIITIILSLLYMLGSFLLYPLPLVAIAIQYFNLVEEKEGVGLRERVEQFGQSLEISNAHEQSL